VGDFYSIIIETITKFESYKLSNVEHGSYVSEFAQLIHNPALTLQIIVFTETCNSQAIYSLFTPCVYALRNPLTTNRIFFPVQRKEFKLLSGDRL